MNQVGRDLGEHGVGGFRSVHAARCGVAEAVQRIGGRDLLVGLVLVEHAASGGDQEVVADRVIGAGVGAPVGIIESEIRPGIVGAVGAGALGQVAFERKVVIDEATGNPQALEGLGRDLGGAVKPFFFRNVIAAGYRRILLPFDVPFHGVKNRQERSEEPQAVLEDVAAEVESGFDPADLVLAVEVLVVDVLGAGAVELLAQGVALFAREGGAGIVADQFAVIVVAAGAGDDVQHAADGAAVLGLVAGSLHLDFFDELEGRGLSLAAPVEIGNIHAVNVELVLGTRGAVDGQSASGNGFFVDTGNGDGQALEIPAAGQGLEGLFIEGHALRRVFDINQRGFPDDRNLFFQSAHFHLDIDG